MTHALAPAEASAVATAPPRPSPPDWLALVKDAGLVAFVVLMLTITMVGVEVADVSGGIDVRSRFGEVASAVVVAFFGRLALGLARAGQHRIVAVAAGGVGLFAALAAAGVLTALKPFQNPVMDWALAVAALLLAARSARAWHGPPAPPTAASEAAASRLRDRVMNGSGPVLVVLALAFPVLHVLMPEIVTRQMLDIGVLVLTYIMLGWGLNIVVGLAGLLDLGYVAFFAVGAYAFALLAQTFGFGFWICLPFAGIMAAFAGLLLGFPVLRLRGDYLAIVTLGFGEIIRIVLLNWYQVTGGPNGLSGIPRPTLFGLTFDAPKPGGPATFAETFGLAFNPSHRIIFLYMIILGLALFTNAVTQRMRRLPIGRAWEALREDEIACRSLGINPTTTKLGAFAMGAMFAGFAGSFFAARQNFISPESFSFIESAVILAIVVLGGFGSQLGVVLAATVLIGLPEAFRDLKDFRMLAFGLAMILIMLWKPSGLLAHREPTLRLAAKQHGAGGGGA